jgi:hypothetical protein
MTQFLDCRLNKKWPLWSSGQSFWLQIQRYRVRLPGLPDFLRSRGPGTGSTQPSEDIEELLNEKVAASV